MRRPRPPWLRTLPVLALSGVLALTACTAGDGAADLGIVRPADAQDETHEEAVSTPAAAPECENVTASYDAAEDIAAASSPALSAIRERGRLVVGVSSDTYLMGARNSFTGQIEGFDIDIARDLAEAISGIRTPWNSR